MLDTRILRDRLTTAEAAADRLSPPQAEGGIAVLAQTTVETAYPTTAGAYYTCTPLLAGGMEVEGAEASFTPALSSVFYAFNLGSQVPPLGTNIIVHSCGGRWAFRYDG